MTAAPAVAPGPAPVAPPPARAASHASADHLAFATVLDSLPSAAAKAAAPATEEQARPSNESTRQESSREQTAHRPLPNDSALFASLPFALRAASMTEERPQAADNSPSVAPATVTGPKSEGSGGSIAAGAKASVGRLIGERAFHFGATASRTFAASAPLAPAGASAANLTPIAQVRREPRRTALRAAQSSLKTRRRPRSRALPVQPRRLRRRDRTPRRSMVARQIRRPPQRRRRRRQVCLALSSRRLSVSARPSNPTHQRQKPQAPTSRPAPPRSPLVPRPPLSRSRRSTSTFRREASRTSR
jgi:hypothetical protein